MNIAWIAGLIILVVLVVMLLAGVPIAIALAVSSICAILPKHLPSGLVIPSIAI